MVGSDICGFYPAPTEELCNRWIELGAFYPFSRDHANFYSPRQELYQWESVAVSARNALGMRYKILPYLYTLTYEAHVSGAPIARPLFFSFPNFADCYGVSTQFLLGRSLMVSPVLEQSKTEVAALFPPGTWYDMFNMTRVIASKRGRFVTLDAPLHVINVHLYQNAILPMQQGGVISKEARKTPFTLVVAFPAGESDGEARGNLFLDDDELPEMKIAEGTSTYVEFYGVKSKGRVKIWSEVVEGQFAMDKGLIVEKVIVLGLDGSGKANGLVVNGGPAAAGVSASTVEQNYQREPLDGDDERKASSMVDVSGLSLPIGRNFSLSWQMGSEI